LSRKASRKSSKRKASGKCSKLPCTIEPADRQVGTSNLKYDKRKKALPPGKRISSSGKVYYEYRRNRSDLTQDEIPESVKKELKKGLKKAKRQRKKIREELRYLFSQIFFLEKRHMGYPSPPSPSS